ncbi:MAG: hypothetical protein HYZ73_02600 [Elusimicrobia bacterium]|nr:hypothetical protein [Elusimicrobiota bacterium]
MRRLALEASAVGGVFLLGLGAFGASASAFSSSQRELRQATDQLSRIQGWAEARQELERLLKTVYPSGPPPRSLQGLLGAFQEGVARSKVQLVSLEPDSSEGALVLKATVKGNPEQLSAFLQQLAGMLPSGMLRRIQFQAQEEKAHCHLEISISPPLAAVPIQTPRLESSSRPGAPPFPPLRLDRLAVFLTNAAVPLAAGPQSPQLILRGVLLGSKLQAYLEEKGTGELFTVTVGDRIGPVKILRIEADRVLFEQEGKQYEARL